MNERALSIDFDGVIFARIPFQWGAIPRLISKKPLDFSPPDVPRIERMVAARTLTLKEKLNLSRHRLPIKEDVADEIPYFSKTMDIYGNTGRLSHFLWTEKTRRALEKAGILKYFENIFYKPDGVETVASKLEAVGRLRETYPQVTHVDDNPRDAIPIALRFPDVQVVILQDRSTGLFVSMNELQQYPNVRRILKIGELRKQR
ncbi:MAG: hypothetical protein Q8P25_00965 [Candidatus Curtissbacteria bacterium]|nr:hypothetical protein [Candidatus Curtissbacteria bacterium]